MLSVVLVTRLKLSTDLTELFPKTAEADMLARVTHVFGGGDVAPVLLRGEDASEVERGRRFVRRARSSPCCRRWPPGRCGRRRSLRSSIRISPPSRRRSRRW
ncbi:MAG: hypothetical protein NVS3B10_29780 [Polyangiales bacterium]